MSSGATLQVQSGISVPEPLTLNGPGLYVANVVNGGSGYKIGDVLTLSGGTFTQNPALLTVTSVSNNGAITGATVTFIGPYSVFPANPVSVSGGSGSLATFNLIPANNGALENSGGNNSWTGPITLQTDSDIGVDPGQQLVVTGKVQDPITPPTPPVPAAAITKVNTGQLAFTSANTYTGLTLVNAGDLDVENPTALGAGISTSTIAASPGGATEAGNVVTITTTAAHGLIVGEPVVIAGVGVAGYNGAYLVSQILSPTSFTYTDPNAGLVASGGGSVTTGMEVQTITVLGASGTFTLTFMGITTPALNINPTPPLTLAVEIQNALDQLLSTLPSPFQGGSVIVTQGGRQQQQRLYRRLYRPAGLREHARSWSPRPASAC